MPFEKISTSPKKEWSKEKVIDGEFKGKLLSSKLPGDWRKYIQGVQKTIWIVQMGNLLAQLNFLIQPKNAEFGLLSASYVKSE